MINAGTERSPTGSEIGRYSLVDQPREAVRAETVQESLIVLGGGAYPTFHRAMEDALHQRR